MIKVTQTEILAMAIRGIDMEVDDWRKKCEKHPEFFDEFTKPLMEKRETLCILYKIETGKDY